MKGKEESDKVGLKVNIQKTKIMASSPITSWEIDGETVTDFILGGLQNHHNGDSSHEIKRLLLLGRKVMTNLDSILNSRNITLPTNVCLVKAMVFPVVMYGCESWTIKKAVHFSRSVVSDSLQPHELQHSRPPCPSPSPGFTQFMSIESVMPSNHLILCHPPLLLPSIFPSIRVFSNELALHIRWPKYWSFGISPSNEYSG